MTNFVKDQIVVYNDCALSFGDIAKKPNHYPSSINVFLKIISRLKTIIKKVIATGEKPLHLKLEKFWEQQNSSALQHHNSAIKSN